LFVRPFRGCCPWPAQATVAGGVRVPPDYLARAALYCVLYSAVAMLLALILFEDRDLA
jgi:hypothetical protein